MVLRLALCGFLVLASSGFSLVCAQGGGTQSYSFSSGGGFVSGTITVNPDGTAVIQGTCGSTGFMGVGQITNGPDGRPHLSCPLYSDGDMLRKQGGSYAQHIDITIPEEDGADGNPTDDYEGEVRVNAAGVGVGSVPVYS